MVLFRLLRGGGLGRGVIHEVLWAGKGARPLFFAAWLARAAMGQQGGRVVWCDPRGEIYPPALAGGGVAPGGGAGGGGGGAVPATARGGVDPSRRGDAMAGRAGAGGTNRA